MLVKSKIKNLVYHKNGHTVFCQIRADKSLLVVIHTPLLNLFLMHSFGSRLSAAEPELCFNYVSRLLKHHHSCFSLFITLLLSFVSRHAPLMIGDDVIEQKITL